VKFEVFRPDLDRTLAYVNSSQGGRPLFYVVIMFRILVIQTLSNLFNERPEYLISDCLSFMRLLGLGLSDHVSDAKTSRLFHERLIQAGVIKRPFDRFDTTLRNVGAAPEQRNINAEKADADHGVFLKTGRQAVKAVPQGSSCALDAKGHENEAAGLRGVCSQRVWSFSSLATHPASPSTESFSASGNGR